VLGVFGTERIEYRLFLFKDSTPERIDSFDNFGSDFLAGGRTGGVNSRFIFWRRLLVDLLFNSLVLS
jgi:hypothetical protein